MSNNFSIRTNLNHMNAPKRTAQCLYFCQVSRTIKDRTGEHSCYTDSYNQCNKTNQRISKRRCGNCVMYKPIINNNND